MENNEINELKIHPFPLPQQWDQYSDILFLAKIYANKQVFPNSIF